MALYIPEVMRPVGLGARQRGLLLGRYAAVNLVGLAGLAVAWRHGLVDLVWQADSSHISVVIAALFAWAVALGGWQAWRLSGALDRRSTEYGSETAAAYRDAVAAGVDPQVAADALKAKLMGGIAFLKQASGGLVTLGLIGTVVGFIVALGEVDASRVGDAASVGPMVAGLIDGMGIALYTTLVGATLGVWCTINHQLLATGAAKLYAAIVESVPCSTRTPERFSATF